MVDPNFAPAARRHDLEWEEHDLESMRIAATPMTITQYEGVTGVQPKTEDHTVGE